MVKKKAKKKNLKKKLTEDEKEELRMEGELPKKSVRNAEDTQLIWFFVIVGLVFAAILIPYFWIESSKSFEYARINWTVEKVPAPINVIWHGRFVSLLSLVRDDGNILNYNLYLYSDPRKNNIPTEGTFDAFKYGGIVSMSPEVDACRGELSRVMIDLGSFLRQGVGIGPLEAGSTDFTVAGETGRRFSRCDVLDERTIVVIEIGGSAVVQSEKNPHCYTIYAEDCDDVSSTEKFMVKSVEDFTNRWA